MKQKIKTKPAQIFAEYEEGNSYKSSIGELGVYEQTKINERFFVGDQWYGAMCGNKRPLVRENIIKRIGEYKMSSIGAAPLTVNYSADGVPNTVDIRKEGEVIREQMLSEEGYVNGKSAPSSPEISVIMDALSNYQKVCAERVAFNIKTEQLLRNAYISGTGISYTYWDDSIETGLYADVSRTKAIKGDIAFEILDVENVNFGDPNNDDVQSQPYIIISQRRGVEDVKREARRNGLNDDEIKPDGNSTYNSGERGEMEPTNSQRVTVLTKLYKEYDSNDSTYKVMAVRVTENAVVRKPWDIGLKRYPIAKFCWERRRSCAYGDSEITYMIPNQVAINRMATAATDSAIKVGMPKVLVNGNAVTDPISNDPGEIIKVYGEAVDVQGAVRYLAPPYFATQYQNLIDSIISNTLTSAGANDAALGDLRPDNATAIMQMREAALQPMQIYQNRYYAYIEDVARIWADFWLNKYGERALQVETQNGTEYIPFKAGRYKNLSLTAKVDVGASTLWGEAVVVSRLDGLLKSQIITPEQYLERMPQGLIPKLTELISDIKKQTEAANSQASEQQKAIEDFAAKYPEEYARYTQLPTEEQQRMLEQILGGGMQQ